MRDSRSFGGAFVTTVYLTNGRHHVSATRCFTICVKTHETYSLSAFVVLSSGALTNVPTKVARAKSWAREDVENNCI